MKKNKIRKFKTILYNCGGRDELILNIVNEKTRKKLFKEEPVVVLLDDILTILSDFKRELDEQYQKAVNRLGEKPIVKMSKKELVAKLEDVLMIGAKISAISELEKRISQGNSSPKGGG